MPEWFSESRVNFIESDEGFSVEVLGQTGIRYSEGPKTTFVDSEVLAEPDVILVYKGSIKYWDPPRGLDAIDGSDRERIIKNIKRAFEFRGYKLRII
jgi:hypothetical protein